MVEQSVVVITKQSTTARMQRHDLYLRYVIGRIDPETLHDQPERHIHCNPVLAQFIQDDDFAPINVEGNFDKRLMDRGYVRDEQALVTRGWRRLKEVASLDLPIVDYPLPEARRKWSG